MYIKLALKERERHSKLFSFIVLQLAITFIVAICCASILSAQFKRYQAYDSIIGTDGWFIYTNLGLRVPEIDVNTGKTGKEILQKYLESTNIICTYSIFGDIMQEDYVLDMESIVYDKELMERMDPAMSEGRWLEENSNNEIEAVISQNYFGLKTGDIVNLVPYSIEEASEIIPIRIVGVLDENAEIIKINYSSNMVDYHNFILNIKDKLEKPLLIMRQKDIERISLQYPSIKDILWPQGMLFIQYSEKITDKERTAYNEFIDNNIEIAIKESMDTIKEKSSRYFEEQISEILPIFFIFLIMTIMSTICVSVLVVKQHIRNLYIYRILGIDTNGCFLIQLWGNMIILCESIVVTIFGCLILKLWKSKVIFLEFGLWQIMICFFIIALWLGITYAVQKITLGDHELWGIKS